MNKLKRENLTALLLAGVLLLGVSPTTLASRMKKMGIKKPA